MKTRSHKEDPLQALAFDPAFFVASWLCASLRADSLSNRRDWCWTSCPGLILFVLASKNESYYLIAMAKAVSYSRDALKTLRRIDRVTAKRIRAKVDQLAADPSSLANNVKALRGDDTGGPMMRLRVGDWRVIYRDEVVIAVIKVGPRGRVYD